MPLPPSCGGCVPQSPLPGWHDRRDHHVLWRQSPRNGSNCPGHHPAGRISSHAGPAGAGRDGRADSTGAEKPLSGVQRPTPMRPCRRSNRQANSRRFHAGRLGRGTDIGAGFRHSGTTRTGPNDHPAHGRHRADDRPLPADRIAENGSRSRPTRPTKIQVDPDPGY